MTGTALIGVPTVLYGHYVNGNELEVVRLAIRIGSWPEGAPPLKVGFLTDLHGDEEQSVDRAHRSAVMVMAESPDIVLLGGDYVSRYSHEWIDPMISAIAPVARAPLGAAGVFGNHDWWTHRIVEIAAKLQQVGIMPLQNRSFEVPKRPGVWVVGVDSATDGHEEPGEALIGVPEDAVKILLVHEPDIADYMPRGFALQLSGHSHAGQVRVFGQPIITPQLAKRYKQGLEQAQDHPVYVSRGVGMVQPAIRFDCPPEVTVLTISG